MNRNKKRPLTVGSLSTVLLYWSLSSAIASPATLLCGGKSAGGSSVRLKVKVIANAALADTDLAAQYNSGGNDRITRRGILHADANYNPRKYVGSNRFDLGCGTWCCYRLILPRALDRLHVR